MAEIPTRLCAFGTFLGLSTAKRPTPTFVAKNPDVQRLIASGRKLTWDEQKEEYKKIVQRISPLVGNAGVSIEVFADFNTSAEEMLALGKEMFSWIPNAYIKYPCIYEGSGPRRCRCSRACG